MTFAGSVKSLNSILMDDGLEIPVNGKACADGKTLRVGDKVMFDLEDNPATPGEYMAGNVSGGSGSPGGGGQWGAAAGGQWGAAAGGWNAAGGGAGQWGAQTAPRTSGKKMKMCTHFPQGTCRKATNCTFAHSEAEIGTTYDLNAGGGAAKGGWGGGGGASWGGAAPTAGTGSNTGTVSNFTPDKGFGFLQSADGSQYFFHQKQFVDGSAPNVGDTLTFDLEPSPLKPGQMQASNITGGSGAGKGGGGKGGGGKACGKGFGGKAFGGGGKAFGKGDKGGFGKGDKGSGGQPLSGKKMKMCLHFPQGACRRGTECTFAHSEAEIGTTYGPAKGGGGKGAAGPYGMAAAWSAQAGW